MQPRNEEPTAERTQASGEDTVEIELTDQEQLALSGAAEAPRALAPDVAPANDPPDRAGDNCLWERTARIDSISTATFAALVLTVAGASLWHTTGFDARTTAAATPCVRTRPASTRRGTQTASFTGTEPVRSDRSIRATCRDHRKRGPRGSSRSAAAARAEPISSDSSA
jgi:hypothetical protein